MRAIPKIPTLDACRMFCLKFSEHREFTTGIRELRE